MWSIKRSHFVTVLATAVRNEQLRRQRNYFLLPYHAPVIVNKLWSLA